MLVALGFAHLVLSRLVPSAIGIWPAREELSIRPN